MFFNNLSYILIGFLLGIFFGYYIFKEKRKIYHGPNSKDIVGKYFKFDWRKDKYYCFIPEICIAPILS